MFVLGIISSVNNKPSVESISSTFSARIKARIDKTPRSCDQRQFSSFQAFKLSIFQVSTGRMFGFSRETHITNPPSTLSARSSLLLAKPVLVIVNS